QRAVEPDPEAAVDVHLAAVVLPGHAEDDLPLRLADPLDDLVLGVLRVPAQHGPERLDHLADGLVELRLAGVALDDLFVDGVDPRLDVAHGSSLGRAAERAAVAQQHSGGSQVPKRRPPPADLSQFSVDDPGAPPEKGNFGDAGCRLPFSPLAPREKARGNQRPRLPFGSRGVRDAWPTVSEPRA